MAEAKDYVSKELAPWQKQGFLVAKDYVSKELAPWQKQRIIKQGISPVAEARISCSKGLCIMVQGDHKNIGIPNLVDMFVYTH